MNIHRVKVQLMSPITKKLVKTITVVLLGQKSNVVAKKRALKCVSDKIDEAISEGFPKLAFKVKSCEAIKYDALVCDLKEDVT